MSTSSTSTTRSIIMAKAPAKRPIQGDAAVVDSAGSAGS
jgi:hypothetical protein